MIDAKGPWFWFERTAGDELTGVKVLRSYSFWPNEANPEYGRLFCADENGRRWTLLCDLAVLQLIRKASRGPLGRHRHALRRSGGA
jgi:hypothetical protein